ncbi:uncharacterized protein LOC133289720 [Gastrolobium bilobum]|uniref:uncharacterized protein LOC133289720 n=1 Tax=Gastrolobium bilobum TaxID=150636 RepID=UPI002AB053B3|nr:uncharacterized protein LOC133289720 [Gastrolobium bilobum]
MDDETKKIAEKNIANRGKQSIPHTLGTKSIARRRREMEIQLGHPITRAQMYAESHKKKDGTLVNEEARHKNEQLLAAQNDGRTAEEAYVHVFGKEHPGRVRGMGFGVCPSQVLGSSSVGSSSTASPNEIKELKSKIESRCKLGPKLWRPDATPNLESPIGNRRSSSASYDPNIHRPSTHGQNEGLVTPLDDDLFMDDI